MSFEKGLRSQGCFYSILQQYFFLLDVMGSVFISEIQRKLEHEQMVRKNTEEKLLEVEKTKSGYSVDLQQLRNQVQSLQTELRNEGEKVEQQISSFFIS